MTLTDSTAAVLMTHNYFHDLELLNVLLNKPLRYVGCLGPKRRTERLLSQICAPVAPETPSFARLHAPVGIDIGAETPSEIALSIAAEILAVLRGRSGGPLHVRNGSIHEDRAATRTEYSAPLADLSLPMSIACKAAGA